VSLGSFPGCAAHRWLVSLGTTVALLVPGVLGAHGGDLDAYGCHHNRKLGGYHCYRGPFAGLAFASQPEMLEQLRASEGKAAIAPKRLAPIPGGGRSATERLEKLKALRQKGLIPEDEYHAKRRAILEGL
jgi:hypothetical protein